MEMTLENVAAKIKEKEFSSLWDAAEYLEYDLGIKSIEAGLDIDKHRWYEITTDVYPIGDRFLGVRGISQMYSEDGDAEDCCDESEAFEMKEISTVTYEKL